MDPRTSEILAAIIREYVETASPIGSFTLLREFNFPFSAATIRNEMALLEERGYLSSPHTSAGRIPTEKGYRYYVENFINESDLSQRESEALKKRILSFSPNYERMLNQAAKTLAEFTGNAGLAGDNGIVYHHGIANLLRQPEFRREDYAIGVAEIFDNLDQLVREIPDNKEVEIYIGQENPIGKSANCSIIVSRFLTPFETKGFLGIIGPTRMSYDRNMDVVNLAKSVLI